MGLPKFQDDLSREGVINQIISSIAMEELSLSHILNAEGEKLQYILGTLSGSSGVNPTFEQVMEANKSVSEMVDSTMQSQMFLSKKMARALDAATMQGPTGPKGDTGPAGTNGTVPAYISAYSVNSTAALTDGARIPLSMSFGPAKSANLTNNALTVGEKGIYAVFCSIKTAAGSRGDVALMYDGSMLANTVMSIDADNLSQSQIATISAEPGKAIYLEVQTGSVTLPLNTNANITMFLIENIA